MALIRETELPLGSWPPAVAAVQQTVQATAEARLRRSSYAALRCVCCEFQEGVLTLRGCVSRYYLKQVAQHLVRGLEGVVEIDNRLDVNPTATVLASAARR